MPRWKMPKTPHGNPLHPFFKTYAFFVLSSALVLFFGIGASLSASFAGSIGLVLSVAMTSLVLGIFSTMILRTVFNLAQTGKVLQYLAFAKVSVLAVLIHHFFFPASLQVDIPILAGLMIFILAFAPATLTGVIPFKKRRWMPVPHKRKG